MTILDHRHKWLTRSQLMDLDTGLPTDFVDYLNNIKLAAAAPDIRPPNAIEDGKRRAFSQDSIADRILPEMF
jgi:hypothetical protein